MLRGLLLGLCILPLMACSTGYRFTMADGSTLATPHAPTLSAGAYHFTDDQGVSRTLYLSQVKRLDKL